MDSGLAAARRPGMTGGMLRIKSIAIASTIALIATPALAHTRETAVGFSAGFVIATGLLHLTGISFGLTTRWPAGKLAVRGAGVVIALTGLAYLSGLA